MSRFTNKLTAAEAERLACLIEELAEAQQIACKILRHGYDSFNPLRGRHSPDNRALLEKELGDVRHWMIRMCEEGDVRKSQIHAWADHKAKTVEPYLHHQKKRRRA